MKRIKFVGLDVHAETIAVAVAEQDPRNVIFVNKSIAWNAPNQRAAMFRQIEQGGPSTRLGPEPVRSWANEKRFTGITKLVPLKPLSLAKTLADCKINNFTTILPIADLV